MHCCENSISTFVPSWRPDERIRTAALNVLLGDCLIGPLATPLGRLRSYEPRRSAWSPVWIELSVNCGTVEDVKRQIRAHLEAGATRVALRPVHANGDCAARDAVLKVMTDF